jgi:Fur family peroxide stress response transcriptional regulator
MFRDVRPEIRETFRRTRLRYTSQRHAMLEHLWQSAGHLTAEQIFAGINHSDPRAARATVYNNLHGLVRAGVLQEVTLGACPVRYDINVRRHHHFLCDRCGGLEDIEVFDVSALVQRPQLGSRIARNCHILFRGTCEQCSKGSNSKTTARRS